jgi:hypothetical protein
MMSTLVYDRAVRRAVIEGQRRRLADFAPARIREQLSAVLEPFGMQVHTPASAELEGVQRTPPATK